jgi:hypothetical protein
VGTTLQLEVCTPHWSDCNPVGSYPLESVNLHAERGGRAKRYFKITGKGLKTVRETHQTLMSLWSGQPRLHGSKA